MEARTCVKVVKNTNKQIFLRKCLVHFQFMPSSRSALSASQRSQTPNAEPFSNLNVHATTAIGNVMQNLLMDSLGGSSGKRYYFFPWSSLSVNLLMLIRKHADDASDKENEDSHRTESYMAYGRTFGRNGDIFNSVNDVVQHGVKLAIADSDDEGEETER
jgi:hypothetical protein